MSRRRLMKGGEDRTEQPMFHPRIAPPLASGGAETAGREPRKAGSLRDRRLAQLHVRDPAAEGQFWYSVVTTGVYCRPTCPSRRARPEHIRLHDSLEEARRTGFRPCRRCRPGEPSTSSRQKAAVKAACDQLRAEPQRSFGEVAAHLGYSRSHLHRLFIRHLGTTPSAWLHPERGGSSSAADLRSSHPDVPPV